MSRSDSRLDFFAGKVGALSLRAAVTFALGCLANALAAPMLIASGAAPTSLIELYTSEGCSSCPPADRWLSTFRDDPRLWRELVPVAFHVDYWDYIGWQDAYASPAHTARQRAYVKSNGLSQVYTPGIVVQGREWRGFFGDRTLDLAPSPTVGRLTLELIDTTHGELRFTPTQAAADPLHYTIVLLGFGLHTHVQRGENAGRELTHDFVVLGLHEGELPQADADYRASVPIPVARQRAARYAIAVWVSRGEDPAPLQVAGGWIPTL